MLGRQLAEQLRKGPERLVTMYSLYLLRRSSVSALESSLTVLLRARWLMKSAETKRDANPLLGARHGHEHHWLEVT